MQAFSDGDLHEPNIGELTIAALQDICDLFMEIQITKLQNTMTTNTSSKIMLKCCHIFSTALMKKEIQVYSRGLVYPTSTWILFKCTIIDLYFDGFKEG